MSEKPKVVILGAGFGGLWAARRLAGHPVDVVLIDKNNYHTFLPLLYQVAAAELEPERIAQPVRYLIRDQGNLSFLLGSVTALSPENKTVTIDDETITFDYLIIALGSTTAFFGVPGANTHCYTLKSIDEAIDLRNHILRILEEAARETEATRRAALLTFTIVGGGATGVEYAGALAELLYQPLEKDFPELELRKMAKVVLIEAGSQLLRGVDDGPYTSERLKKIGVEVRLNTVVEAVEEGRILIKDHDPLPTDTIVWAAGVRGQRIGGLEDFQIDRGGQITVLESLQTPQHPNIYVIGDIMRFESGPENWPLPNTAQVAMQSGEVAAENILNQISKHPMTPFVYKDKGVMATIGRNAAVAKIGGRQFTGFIAWIIWLFIHLFFLIGFRNRLGVLVNWAWNYIWYERVVRLIMPISDSTPQAKAINN